MGEKTKPIKANLPTLAVKSGARALGVLDSRFRGNDRAAEDSDWAWRDAILKKQSQFARSESGVNTVIRKDYDKMSRFRSLENKANSNPIEASRATVPLKLEGGEFIILLD